ncbi:(-)-germacrene D synthase-like [Ziziphus jujuba]|uniref:(-)-germacrene D synthase-like n=1 Tax=Ziziphus jujuba TaxID=326968 RepID=A0ABM3I4V3_ZIZJJ|nr:(-)-germacrene D synthase-like [Ziziphus jujuba]
MSRFSVVDATSQSTNSTPQVIRRCANFHPSIWGNHFLAYASTPLKVDSDTEQQVQKLKDEVEKMLTGVSYNPSEKLQLVDDIQRLGLSYHFHGQIYEILRDIHKISIHSSIHNSDLYTVSLWFRLLRQAGFNMSSDVFEKFTNKEGKFNKALASDAKGMLSLYEAAHLRVHGEQILEEALTFTATHLSSSSLTLTTTKLSPSLAAQIKHALSQPIWKTIPRAEARHFISLYQQDPSHGEALLTLAKMDFNILQRMHQKELAHITKWWKDLDFVTKLPFARDRVVEGYFWSLGVYYEPQYSLARKLFTKVIVMSSIIDDIYDVHGTHDELLLFTDAIERWDLSSMDQLPNYMRYCYEELLNVYKEIEEVMTKEGREYRVDYAIEEMKKLVRVYLVESKWFSNNYTPTLEEYLAIGLRSCGYSMLTITSFLGMGDVVTKEGFDWISEWPRILQASCIICRFTDDVVGHKFEQERGHVASSVECYVKQHGVSENEAYVELRKRIVEAWKDINEEWVEPRDMPMTLLERVINLARMMDLLYKDSDGYTHSGGTTKKIITSLLVDPIPI